MDDWEGHQPGCDTVVTVFESSGPGAQDGPVIDDKINLRAAVYYSKLAAYAEVSIKGFQDLRQVMIDASGFRSFFYANDSPCS